MKGYLTRSNLEYLEQVYEEFKTNPKGIDKEWMRFFEGIEFAKEKGLTTKIGGPELLAQKLIKMYRDYGHLKSKLDPLGRLDDSKEFNDFENIDQTQRFDLLGFKNITLAELTNFLEKTYCQKIALQAANCTPKAQEWFFKEFEKSNFKLSKDQKIKVLKQLARTESLEKFIHTRYVGVKRFSIEGCDTLIPMLEHLAEAGTDHHAIEEITIGMAHRGRVNVLANFMNKALKSIFAEFNGHMGADEHYDSDVKYHMGFSSDKKMDSGKSCHVSLAFNPSHLEAVNPVVCGMTRAKQRLRGDIKERRKVIPILIHGDAAVIGQGVVAETFQLSKLKGYTVGGTIHIILNNQIGFTTKPSDSRSTRYASDIALSIKAPVILVNADDPEECVRATDMALRYRQEFKEDVVIDLIGYRRFGHNEGDEPAFTQPLMYDKIKKHPTTYKTFTEKLNDAAIFTKSESQEFLIQKLTIFKKFSMK